MGIGTNIGVITLTWKYFYWEITNLLVTFRKSLKSIPGHRVDHSYKLSTILGFPFWISKHHEFRIGTGPSLGMGSFMQTDKYGLTEAYIASYFNWAFKASWIIHFRKHFALEAGGFAEIPFYHYSADISNYYRPFVGAFLGIRF